MLLFKKIDDVNDIVLVIRLRNTNGIACSFFNRCLFLELTLWKRVEDATVHYPMIRSSRPVVECVVVSHYSLQC